MPGYPSRPEPAHRGSRLLAATARLNVVLENRVAAAVSQGTQLTQQHNTVLQTFRQPTVYVLCVRVQLGCPATPRLLPRHSRRPHILAYLHVGILPYAKVLSAERWVNPIPALLGHSYTGDENICESAVFAARDGAVLADQHDERSIGRRYLTPLVPMLDGALPDEILAQPTAAKPESTDRRREDSRRG